MIVSARNGMIIRAGRIFDMQNHADFSSALTVDAFEVAHRVSRRHGKKRKSAKNDHEPA
jgi:hypothetical protein